MPKDSPLLIFGAIGGVRDPRKGFDLLLQALEHLRNDQRAKGMELIVFGQCAPQSLPNLGFPIHYTGHIYDDLRLRALYSAADVMVVPSRQEAFGQTASEAHACGTPVVAFNIGGLPDIVNHQRTGYLAKVFDTEDLAEGIAWILQHPMPYSLQQAARVFAEKNFDPKRIGDEYLNIYKKLVNFPI